MAKRKDTEASSTETPPIETPKVDTPKIEAVLPMVESPSISPATAEPKIENLEPIMEPLPAIDPAAVAPETAPVAETVTAPAMAKILNFTLRPRHKRYALLAASVAIAAALGGIIGATATSRATAPQTADIQDRKAMEESIGRLAKEVTTLKSNLDAANKAAHSQIAKISERIERTASAELVTGSISPPQTVAPLPTSRPAPRVAAVETQSPARSMVVQGWSIRDARDGFVYVQGNGDIYQVVPGAPLPGLGPVESVTRRDGRWVVTTPRGIIVSMRDRRYFE
jgi:hypothetical protein